MPEGKKSLLSHLKRFHDLIMQPGLDVEAFLGLMGKIFKSQDVCIMQLNEKDKVLKTIFTNPKTLPVKDIILQKNDIFSIIRCGDKFKTFFLKDSKNYIYPEVLIEEGIKSCILGSIDVMEVTEEFLLIGTHNEDVVFLDEDVMLCEILSNFLSVKFREQQLFKESKILELAAQLGLNLSLEYLRKLHITEDFLNTIMNDINIYDLARRKVVNSLKLFKVKTEMEGRFYIQDILSRTKNFSSIMEKMVRRNINYNEFDDIAGIRVIVNYLSDIDKVVKFIKQNAYFEIVEDGRKIEKPGPENYRGHHLTVAVETDDLKIDGQSPRCEIQIRTSYQDSWSTKAHEETYKQELNDRIKTSMALLSDQLYIADQQSEILRESIRELKQEQKKEKKKNK